MSIALTTVLRISFIHIIPQIMSTPLTIVLRTVYLIIRIMVIFIVIAICRFLLLESQKLLERLQSFGGGARALGTMQVRGRESKAWG